MSRDEILFGPPLPRGREGVRCAHYHNPRLHVCPVGSLPPTIVPPNGIPSLWGSRSRILAIQLCLRGSPNACSAFVGCPTNGHLRCLRGCIEFGMTILKLIVYRYLRLDSHPTVSPWYPVCVSSATPCHGTPRRCRDQGVPSLSGSGFWSSLGNWRFAAVFSIFTERRSL